MPEWMRQSLIRFFLSIKGTKVWRFCNLFPTAKIGNNCVIGSYVEVGDGVIIGNNCKIEANVFIPKGVLIGNNVFVGPGVVFINDLYPKACGDWKVYKTEVGEGASIGAASVILCGVKIGNGAKIAAGSVVTKDVPENETVAGIPAKEIISKW